MEGCLMKSNKDTKQGKAEMKVKSFFRRKGYSVEQPKTSNDQGIDMIAEKDHHRIAIQVTDPSESTIEASINGTIRGKNSFHCDKSLIIVDTNISPEFYNAATKKGIDIVSLDSIEHMNSNNFQ